MKKNKIWKRAGAVILCTALLFGTLPTGVMAEETVGHDTNEEELLSEEVVSEDEPAEEILPEEVLSEEEVNPDTAEMESEDSESTGETGESESDSQYHFTEGDVASIQKGTSSCWNRMSSGGMVCMIMSGTWRNFWSVLRRTYQSRCIWDRIWSSVWRSWIQE